MVFFFASLPVLEVGAVPKIETGHERPAEQSRGRRQPWRTLGAEPVGPVRMIDSHELADLVNITAPVVAVQPDTGSVAVEPPPRKTGPQRRQGPSQGRPGPIGIQVGPQEVGELLSGRLFSGDRQVGEQRDCFACVDFEGLPIHRDLGRPQQGEAKAGRGFCHQPQVRNRPDIQSVVSGAWCVKAGFPTCRSRGGPTHEPHSKRGSKRHSPLTAQNGGRKAAFRNAVGTGDGYTYD
jgi:hypothetical protein